MLNAIIATARKDLRLMAKDPGALAVLFVMPLVFIVVMSLATTKLYDPSAKAIVVAVADEDRGEFATELVRELKATGGFDVITEWQGKLLDRASAERLIVERRQQVVVVIPAGLSEALRNTVTGQARGRREIFLVTDPSLSPQVLAPLRGALNGLAQQSAFRSVASVGIDQMVARVTASGGSIPESFAGELKSRATQVQNDASGFLAVKEAAPAGMASERRPNSVEQNVPGYTLLGLFFIAMQLAANILEEKRLGTFRRLLAAPVPRWALMAGKLIAFVAINIIQVAVMFAIGVWLLPRLGAPSMSLGTHPEGLVVVTLAVALAANSLGLLLAALARTPAQSTGLGLIVVLTSAMIGGVMVPRFVMPPFMQTFGLISPHTWGLLAYQDVLMRGADVAAILPAIAILLGFAAAFFGVAVWRLRWD
jgi:ABC-2 type transport system permease protein